MLPLRLPNALDGAVDTGDPQEHDGVPAVTEGADHARSCRNASPTEVGTADSENHDDRSRVKPRALMKSCGITLMLVAMPKGSGLMPTKS